MAAHLCVFEDDRVRRLNPLVLFRPAFDLRCGISTLLEKVQLAAPRTDLALFCRSYLAATVRQQFPRASVNQAPSDSAVFWNGRAVADAKLLRRLLKGGQDILFVAGNDVVGARVSGKALERVARLAGSELGLEAFDGLPREDVQATLIHYPWDLVARNGKQITEDSLRFLEAATRRRKSLVGVHLISPKEIAIGEGAKVLPGVVLDASDGPIVIGRNAKIFPNAVIIGPTSIGDDSFVKVGAQIYEDTTIGPVCKVGGEVEAAILHSYSSKQHAGFIGHAYLGSWVNIGADTNNSDLKNNYGNVKVTINGEAIDTGKQFVGLTMGDHSKSAINTMFNTGTVVGVSSNVFGSGFPSKSVPSFAWGAAGGSTAVYNVDKAIQVAKRVMARRKVTMTAADEQLFRDVFAMTASERKGLSNSLTAE